MFEASSSMTPVSGELKCEKDLVDAEMSMKHGHDELLILTQEGGAATAGRPRRETERPTETHNTLVM